MVQAIAWPEAYSTELEVPGGFSETDRALLSICFCESCRQRAAENDLDSAAAQRAVRVAIEQSVNGERGGELDFAALCERTELLARFVDQRPAILAALLDRLADVCTVDLLVRASRDGPARGQHRDLLPHDRARAMFEITFEMSAGSDAVSALLPGVGELSIRSASHDKTDAPKLVGLVTTAAESGVRGVTFEHYGLWNDTALTAIKQAVRFARRTTTA